MSFSLPGAIVLLIRPSTVELSVMAVVLCCGWPISVRALLGNTAFLQMKYYDATSVSPADSMACLMFSVIIKIASLFRSFVPFLIK